MLSRSDSESGHDYSTAIFSSLCGILLVTYVCLANVWTFADIVNGLVLLGVLWGPAGLLVYRFVRPGCADAIEASTLAACGSLTIVTAVNCLICTLSYWVQSLQILWPIFIAVCLLLAVVQLVLAGRKWRHHRECLPTWSRIPWLLIALILGSLLVTARYQRPVEKLDAGRASRFVLNGDQTFFASIAYELQRNNPPQQHPCRAGVPERAYHHFPHLTLAISGTISGQSDLLRLNLTVIYSAIVILHVLLAFCIARILGGDAAGCIAAGMIFVAAIPMEPMNSAQEFFYFSWFPQATSTVEPTLLTSPQMFYGLVPGIAAILSLLTALRNSELFGAGFRHTILAAALTAFTLKFRVHCFLVLAPTVFGLFAIHAWNNRRWQLLVPIGAGLLLIVLQMLEMRLPIYLAQSQSVGIGFNNVLDSAQFYNAWPGAASLRSMLAEMSRGSEVAWTCSCILMFCILNIVGALQSLAVLVGMWICARSPAMKWGAVIPPLLLLSTLFATCFIRSGYDSYSVGGQIPFQLGWFLLPWVAVGVTSVFRTLLKRLSIHEEVAPRAVTCLAVVFVLLQMNRAASPIERKNFRESMIFDNDDAATLNFVRTSLPNDAVILTGLLHPNYALWSGIGGRRTYLDYVPAGAALDPVLASEDQAAYRANVISRLQTTDREEEFHQFLRGSHATHIIELTEMPLTLHPNNDLRKLWTSPRGRLCIWEVRPIDK